MNFNDFFHPPLLDVVTSLIATASLVAAVTPNKYDNVVLQAVRAIIDTLALNFGNARNVIKR